MKTTLRLLNILPVIIIINIWGCEMEENDIKQLENEINTEVLVMDYNARRPEITTDPGLLIAGQSMEAGTVTVTENGDFLIVTVNTNAEWCLSEIHMHVANDVSGIPQTKKGNPKIGNFSHSTEFDACMSSYSYEFKKPDHQVETSCYAIAVHAAVKEVLNNRLNTVEFNLPDQVTMEVAYPGGDSYFNTTVSGGTILDGEYNGWCIDTDNQIYSGRPYSADVYSSYETAAADLVEFPEYLEMVNWIINQNYTQKTAGCDGKSFTYGDVQRAIWELLEDNYNGSNGPWTRCHVDEILASARAYGTGFVPACGNNIAVILVPEDDMQIIIAQVTLIKIDINCEIITGQEETAWGSGNPFNTRGNWAMYSEYCISIN